MVPKFATDSMANSVLLQSDPRQDLDSKEGVQDLKDFARKYDGRSMRQGGTTDKSPCPARTRNACFTPASLKWITGLHHVEIERNAECKTFLLRQTQTRSGCACYVAPRGLASRAAFLGASLMCLRACCLGKWFLLEVTLRKSVAYSTMLASTSVSLRRLFGRIS